MAGFFVGWPSAPDAAGLLRVLGNSTVVVLALNDDHVVGFINALSDGELATYIPMLEVRPSHQHLGLGSELVRRLFDAIPPTYMVDLVCDPDRAGFYDHLGMTQLAGMALRNRSAPILVLNQ